MAVGQACSVALEGTEGNIITVECDVSRGLPGISIVGLGDGAVLQAKDRIRAALNNTKLAGQSLSWPGSRTVMSLSPAGIRKQGASYDLAMVVAMISATTATPIVGERAASSVIVGELGLDGTIRPVPGVLQTILAAARSGFGTVVLPEANALEAAQAEALLSGQAPKVLVAATLREVIEWLHGLQLMTAVEAAAEETEGVADTAVSAVAGAGSPDAERMDLCDVIGQEEARSALEVAAAGGHALLLLGSPGSGKSMLARRLPGILPPLTGEEKLESALVHSVAGQKSELPMIWRGQRPFIAPHHGVTQPALIGGGAVPTPGAVSLAHHGVLFIDEAAETKPGVLDALRVPLDSGSVELSRQRGSVTYPANFQLVLAANPCPCGAEKAADCTCGATIRRRHLSFLSGPLRDRIDITARTTAHRAINLLGGAEAESSAAVSERVVLARERQYHRWGAGRLNAQVPGRTLRREHPASDEGMAMLQDMLRTHSISQRGVDRALRVSWTLADLAGIGRPGLAQVCDAVDYFSGAEELS